MIQDLMVDSWIMIGLRLSFKLDQVPLLLLLVRKPLGLQNKKTLSFWFVKEPK